MSFRAIIISNGAKDPKGMSTLMEAYLKHEGFSVSGLLESNHTQLLGDLEKAVADHALIVVVGGTFVGLKENSPEILQSWSDCHLPGFGELMRFETVQNGFTTYMQRSGAWVKGQVLAIAVPANTKAALDHIKVLGPLMMKTVKAMSGESQEANPNVIEVSPSLN